MKNRLVIVTLAAVLALPAAFVPAAAAGNGVSVSRFPISFSMFNPCTNENVELSGIGLGLIDTTPEDGHFVFHAVDVSVSGVGETTGARYGDVFSIATTFAGSFDDGPFAETLSVHSRLITPGGGNDLDFRIVFHFTITANGDVAVVFNRLIDGTCV